MQTQTMFGFEVLCHTTRWRAVLRVPANADAVDGLAEAQARVEAAGGYAVDTYWGDELRETVHVTVRHRAI